jgi:hypothetical protein
LQVNITDGKAGTKHGIVPGSFSKMLGRKAYGFEIKKEYVDRFYSTLAANVQTSIFSLSTKEQGNTAKSQVTMFGGKGL